jgi:NTE family protein
MPSTPDSNGPLAVVLAGGGARAAYQVGVLSAVAEAYPDLDIPIYTGVSAGGINTGYLAAHPGPFADAVEGLRAEWGRLVPDNAYAIRPMHIGRAAARWARNMLLGRSTGPPVLRGVLNMAPLGAFLASIFEPEGIHRNIQAGRLRAVAVSATSYTTGQTVTFLEGTADVPTWERAMRVAVRTRLTLRHLLASAAIPIIFPAVKIDGAYYGDGSVRQTAPLAPAIHLGAGRILAVAMRAGARAERPAQTAYSYPVAAEVFGLLLHSVFLDTLDADAERLQRINFLLHSLPPGAETHGLREVGLMMIRPSRDVGALARGYALHVPRGVEFLIRSVGGGDIRASDFLSYLLFHQGFIQALTELGYEDTRRRRGELEDFLGGSADRRAGGSTA